MRGCIYKFRHSTLRLFTRLFVPRSILRWKRFVARLVEEIEEIFVPRFFIRNFFFTFVLFCFRSGASTRAETCSGEGGGATRALPEEGKLAEESGWCYSFAAPPSSLFFASSLLLLLLGVAPSRR